MRRSLDAVRANARTLRKPNKTAISCSRASLIAGLAGRYRLPSIGATRNFAKDGGLMAYDNRINLVDQYREAATYVDRILKRTKPGDLPVQAANRYTFVINLKTAKAHDRRCLTPTTGPVRQRSAIPARASSCHAPNRGPAVKTVNGCWETRHAGSHSREMRWLQRRDLPLLDR
jgi:hypothetical protein